MTEQRQRFADRYFETLNATQSAIYAGYSEQSAKSQASQLLDEDEVQEYLQKLREEYQIKSGINKQRILEEYAKIAFSDIRELYAGDNQLLDVRQIDDSTAGAVMAVEVDEMKNGLGMTIGYTKKVKLYNKIQALQDLGKHLGIFEKDNSQKAASMVTIFKLPDNGRS